MSVLLRKQYSSIKKEKLSEQAKSVLKSMYETTNGFKDAKATRKIKPKFEAFYNKLKESKPEAIVGGKAKSKAAPKKSADDFKAARDRRKKQTGVPKDKNAVDKDATRPAINVRGRRTSKAGNTYYEYRDNRFDKNPSKYPMLEKGGYMGKGGNTNNFKINYKLKPETLNLHLGKYGYDNYANRRVKNWNVDDFKSYVYDYSSGDFEISNKNPFLKEIFISGNLPIKDGEIMPIGANNNEYYNKYKSSGAVMYDVWTEIIKQNNLKPSDDNELLKEPKPTLTAKEQKELDDYEKLYNSTDFDVWISKDSPNTEELMERNRQLQGKRNLILDHEGKLEKGGKTQGYDDREDERLSMEHGKMSDKDLDSTHARRDDARFEERMAKGGETHRLDSVFEDGGEIAEGNLEMAMSNVKAIEHHANELQGLLDEDTSIEAWVVAKLERAETDLSDVTHYIDGLKSEEVESDTYFARGGFVSKGELVWRKLSNSKKMEFLHENFTPQITPRSQETLVGKDFQFLPKDVKIKLEAKYADVEEYAQGGELTPYIIWVSKDGEKREMFGEYKSKRAADMKMNKLWESGEYKTMGNKPKSMYEKEGFYGDGGMMAKGGELDKDVLKKIRLNYDIYKDGKNQEHYNDFNDSVKVRNHIEKTTGLKVSDIKELEIGKNYPYNDLNPYYYDTYEVKLSKGKPFVVERMYGRPRWTGNVAYTNGIEVKDLWQMADGGMMAKGGQVSGKFLFRPYKREGNFFVSTQLKNVDPNSEMVKGVQGKLKGANQDSAENIALEILKQHDNIDRVEIVKEGSSVLKNKKVGQITRSESYKMGFDREFYAQGGRLSRKQKQLDLNKNGKLDAQDFKMLRAGRKNARKK